MNDLAQCRIQSARLLVCVCEYQFMKSQIIERLGQADILLPSLIAEGLAANDRVKARLSVLQTASRHARDPHSPRFDLSEECRAAGLDAVAMDALINGAVAPANDQITAPGLAGCASPSWTTLPR